MFGLKARTKPAVFAVAYGVILLVATFAGIEAIASLFVPSWPARALRIMPPHNPVSASVQPYADFPWLADRFNSWGMRDRERMLTKAAGVDRRVVVVGDSFVESSFTRLSLPAAIEQGIGNRTEVVNLGISATGLRSYYYRLRDVALKAAPDQLVLVIYTGNDFVLPGEGYGEGGLMLTDVSLGPSLIGAIMPRTHWLLVNRLKLIDVVGGTYPVDEETTLYGIVQESATARSRLAAHMRKFHASHLSLETIEEVIGRGDDRFWKDLDRQTGEREFLLGWTLSNVLTWETGTFPVATRPEEAARITEEALIDASASWIIAADRLAREHRIPLRIFIAPVATIDPDYVEFWRPWPRSFSWNWICDDREERLVAKLSAAGVHAISLRDDLAGIPGTYRKRDGHWTEKGQEIVVRRMVRELNKPQL